MNLTGLLKGNESYGGRDAVVEIILLEHFYNCLLEQERNWLQDLGDITSVTKVAELIEKYASHRQFSKSPAVDIPCISRMRVDNHH